MTNQPTNKRAANRKPRGRIAALVPNMLGWSPGQRVRIEHWATHLETAGWQVDFYPFEDPALHKVLYRPSNYLAKTCRLTSCYVRQLRRVMYGLPADVIFVYREAALVGPALLERLAARYRVPVVYDIDDPLFVPYSSPTNGRFAAFKFHRKTHTLFRMSAHVIAINRLIGDYAARFNPSVSAIPNCVDVERFRPAPTQQNRPARLGWIGSHSTLPNLLTIVEPIRRLQLTHPEPLRVIAPQEPNLLGLRVDFHPWSAEGEIRELQQCDIGLVPLLADTWAPWKFFLKTIQYMAVGLPVVARRLGSNTEVIEDGINGFLVDNDEEWHDRLQVLIEDAELRHRMGAAARETVLQRYSSQVQMPRVANVFEAALSFQRS